MLLILKLDTEVRSEQPDGIAYIMEELTVLLLQAWLHSKQYSFHIIEYMGTFGGEQYFTVTADGNPGVFSTSRFTDQTGITLNSGLFNNVAWGDYDNDGFVDILVPRSPFNTGFTKQWE